MKKTFFLTLFMSICLALRADVTFSFSANSIENSTLKNSMERSISQLLSEINRAAQFNTNLNLASINMEEGAKDRLNAFWSNIRFVCDDDYPVSKCLQDYQGYQVRNIKIIMKPQDNTYDGKINRELTISLNKKGIITGVRPAMELQEDVNRIMSEGSDVNDLTMRREILKWIEDFRNYYNERNIKSLEQIYSEDALIITGSVVQQIKSNVISHSDELGPRLTSTVKYTVQTKTEYINKLKRIFNNQKYLNVKFDKITVSKHNAKANFYGVTLKQSWNSSGYSDEGWLFLFWDFNDRENPKIIVRTWQTDQMVSNDGVFTLDDFFIP